MLCWSSGELRIDETGKVNVVVDPELVELIRALIPKARIPARQRYAPHITVVRDEEFAVVPEGFPATVGFWYDPEPVEGETYWWLRVEAEELIQVRRSLGLPDTSEQSRPPDGMNCFHITIGNTKHRAGR